MSRSLTVALKPFAVVTRYLNHQRHAEFWAVDATDARRRARDAHAIELDLPADQWISVIVVSCVVDYSFAEGPPSTRVSDRSGYERPYDIRKLQDELLKIQHRLEAENHGHANDSPLGIIASDLNDLIATMPQPPKPRRSGTDR